MLVYCIGWHAALICRETHALRTTVLWCLDLMAGMLGCFPLVVAALFPKVVVANSSSSKSHLIEGFIHKLCPF